MENDGVCVYWVNGWCRKQGFCKWCEDFGEGYVCILKDGINNETEGIKDA